MPALSELIVNDVDPVLTTFVDNYAIIEPLDGPTTVEDVMDRFPEEVYQQGRDTHLYKFLQAIAGDAGAGLVKKQAYAARLKFEAEFLNFKVLDEFYAAQLRLNRLASETYSDYDPSNALTPDEWDVVQLADQSYRHRIAEFWEAVRYGNSPQGIKIMAQAGSGLPCDVIEHYKYIFDQYSDDKLSLTAYGVSTSTAEFVVLTRLLNDLLTTSYKYTTNIKRTTTFTAPTLTTTSRPFPAPAGGNKMSTSTSFSAVSTDALVPDIERNMVDVIDRIRPVAAMSTFKPEPVRYVEVSTNAVYSSTERLHLSRFVEGSTGVVWPAVDTAKNYFVEAGVEKEAGSFYGSARELPVVFQTIENVSAYSDAALADEKYGTNSFFEASGSSPSAYESYKSVHTGRFPPALQAIFPFVSQVTENTSFASENAVANQDTPLMLEGRFLEA